LLLVCWHLYFTR